MTSKTLLLVEDEVSMGETLQEALTAKGHVVFWATDLRQALQWSETHTFAAALLDLNLPDGSGLDLARELRKKHKSPILFMTALNTAENRLTAYELGAAEFIPKPFHLRELYLRLEHVLNEHAGSKREQLTIGRGVLSFSKRCLSLPNQQEVFFQTKDFDVLKVLIDQAPEVVSRDTLLNQIWGEEEFPTPRTVDNSIVRIRQILSEVLPPQTEVIRSVRGIGYQWIGENNS